MPEPPLKRGRSEDHPAGSKGDDHRARPEPSLIRWVGFAAAVVALLGYLGLNPPWAGDGGRPSMPTSTATADKGDSGTVDGEGGSSPTPVKPPTPDSGVARALTGVWSGKVQTTAVAAPWRATVRLTHPESALDAGTHDVVALDDDNRPDPAYEHCLGRMRLVATKATAFTYRVVNDSERSTADCDDAWTLTVTYVTRFEVSYELTVPVFDPYVGTLLRRREPRSG